MMRVNYHRALNSDVAYEFYNDHPSGNMKNASKVSRYRKTNSSIGHGN